MYNSDSSYYNESLEEYIKEKRKLDEEEAQVFETERAVAFTKYFERHQNDPNSIFNLPGTVFIKFTPQKIKFSFQPCRVERMVSRKFIFFVSLHKPFKSWLIKHDSIPGNYKMRAYSLFHTRSGFRFKNDASIIGGIREIVLLLIEWAEGEHRFRTRKMQKYRNGEDVYLDEDDEELFLSESEIEELHAKREAIWKRMLPPSSIASRTRAISKRKNVRSRIIHSDSD